MAKRKVTLEIDESGWVWRAFERSKQVGIFEMKKTPHGASGTAPGEFPDHFPRDGSWQAVAEAMYDADPLKVCQELAEMKDMDT